MDLNTSPHTQNRLSGVWTNAGGIIEILDQNISRKGSHTILKFEFFKSILTPQNQLVR
jgi:hypothetical protein